MLKGEKVSIKIKKAKTRRLVRKPKTKQELLNEAKKRTSMDPKREYMVMNMAKEKAKRKRFGKRIGTMLATAKALREKGKATKTSEPGVRAARLLRQSELEFGRSPYTGGTQYKYFDEARKRVRGMTKKEVAIRATEEFVNIDRESKDDRGFKKVRGQKPTSYEIAQEKKWMNRPGTNKYRLNGVLPVVATLAAGWLTGELKKKKGKR